MFFNLQANNRSRDIRNMNERFVVKHEKINMDFPIFPRTYCTILKNLYLEYILFLYIFYILSYIILYSYILSHICIDLFSLLLVFYSRTSRRMLTINVAKSPGIRSSHVPRKGALCAYSCRSFVDEGTESHGAHPSGLLRRGRRNL